MAETSSADCLYLRRARPAARRYNRQVALNVFVLGKDPLARAGLASLLAREASIQLAGHAALDEFAAAHAGQHLDALVIDAGSGLDGVRELEPHLPSVLLVSDEGQAADALSLGARGVILRRADGAQIAAALVAAVAGLLVVDPTLETALLRPRATATPQGDPLTRRETEVLQHLSLGLSNKAIAARLGISEHTAKFHVNAILAKLGAGSRAEAIVRAARSGLVAL